MDILGGVVLIDPDTREPYAAPYTETGTWENAGLGIIGAVVLIDPETNLPYRYGTAGVIA